MGNFLKKLCIGYNFFMGIFVPLLKKSRSGVSRHIYQCCSHKAFSFNHIFHEDYILVEILSWDIFISMFIKEVSGRVCRHEYLYHANMSHSTLKTFSIKIIHQFKFYQGMFPF